MYNQSIPDESIRLSPGFGKSERISVELDEPVAAERGNRTISPYVDELSNSRTE